MEQRSREGIQEQVKVGRAKKENGYPNPKFKDLEEEARYWENHSPLLEGYQGKVQKRRLTPRPLRASFLSLRMSGEELELLRKAAEDQDIGPTTLARRLILEGLRNKQFDYSKARPNRFADRLGQDRLMVVLDPDVAVVFRTAESVNKVLRALIATMPDIQEARSSG